MSNTQYICKPCDVPLIHTHIPPKAHHHCQTVQAITRTAAHRTLEHRLKDAVKWWSTPVDERKGVPPVVETTATGKKTGQPSTAEIACQISAAVFLALVLDSTQQNKGLVYVPSRPRHFARSCPRPVCMRYNCALGAAPPRATRVTLGASESAFLAPAAISIQRARPARFMHAASIVDLSSVCPVLALFLALHRPYYARPSPSIMPGQTWRDNGHKALCPLSRLDSKIHSLPHCSH